MISLSTVFWSYVLLFSLIGAFRGWAKEVLVMFSLIVAMFINTIIGQFLSGVNVFLLGQSSTVQFAVRAIFFVALALFGYQSPVISSGLGAKARRESFQDLLLGAGFGALNGYLLVGTLWFYLDRTSYPIPGMSAPVDPEVIEMLRWLPPNVIGGPPIYFAVGLAFVFLLVVFI